MIQLAIIYDNQLVIEGLQSTLRDEPDMRVVAANSSTWDLIRGHDGLPVEILLLDLQLLERQDSTLIQTLMGAYPGLGIIILGSAESSQYIAGLMRMGCKGYVLKRNSGKEQLTQAIRQVRDGGIYLEPWLKDQLLHEMLSGRRRMSRVATRVTQREREVLQLILDELSNQEIATRLFISQRTVETHRYNLQQKLNVRNTAGLVRAALQMGLV